MCACEKYVFYSSWLLTGASGAGRSHVGRPRHSMPAGITSQPNTDPSSTSSSSSRDRHRHSISDTDETAASAGGRRSAFLEPLPLSHSSSAANSSGVSSPTLPSSATGQPVMIIIVLYWLALRSLVIIDLPKVGKCYTRLKTKRNISQLRENQFLLGLYRIADFTIRPNKNNSFYYSVEYE